MTTEIRLPSSMEVKSLFDGMLGRDVDIMTGSAWVPTPLEPAAVAEYVTDRFQLGAAAITDIKLSILAGAAMGLLPRGGAEDMIENRNPTTAVMENLYELLNVLSATLNKPDSPHVRLNRMHEFGQPLPADIQATLQMIVNRLDLIVDIPGYGKGRLAILLPR